MSYTGYAGRRRHDVASLLRQLAWLAAASIFLLAEIRPALSAVDLVEPPAGMSEPTFSSYLVELQEPPLASAQAAPQGQANAKKAATDAKAKRRDGHAEALRDINAKVRKHRDSDVVPRQEYFNAFNGMALDISEQEAKEVLTSPYVKAIYPDVEVHAMLQETVVDIHAIEAWSLQRDSSARPSLTGRGVVIAIIDTGVDYKHPDLGGGLGPKFKVIGGYDFVNNDADPMDDFGHGTHVAGIAAGKGDYNHNGIYEPEQGEVWGVAPDASILAYKVLGANGSGSTGSIMAAIDRALDPNEDGDFSDRADVANLSLGTAFGTPDDVLSQAADRAVDAGMVVVVSAGNSGPGTRTISSPAAARNAIAVGAVYKQDYTGLYWQGPGPATLPDRLLQFTRAGPALFHETGPGGARGADRIGPLRPLPEEE